MFTVLVSSLALGGCATASQVGKLVLAGDSRSLRERDEGAPARSSQGDPVLVLALDGVDRALLYDLLKQGQLPGFAKLVGGSKRAFPHAHFSEELLTTLPSSTMAAWSTMFTGVTPAHHGVAGNEFFIRETRTLGAPAPVTFSEAGPTIACFTEDEYLNSLLHAPTVYERMRQRDPDVLVWVAMQHVYAGADLLLLADRTAFARAFEDELETVVVKVTEGKDTRDVYESLDREVMEVVIDELDGDDAIVPDVLTVYLSGTDLYGHVAAEGPDASRRDYLKEIADQEVGKLADALIRKGELENRWVIITSDHGHTEVLNDDAHSLASDGDDEPPEVLEKAGFRLRPFALEVDDDDDFQAVFTAGGAMAYVYLADCSRCAAPDSVCSWALPPRFEEDVLVAAEAFHRANTVGAHVPAMKGTIDLILTRRPKPYREVDAPFEVYAGDGKLVPISEWLGTHPHPTYVALEARMRDLGVGPRGERAGDIVLIANNGNRDTPAERFYFASPYRSWHGSPSRKDSEVPLIVANRRFDATAIGERVNAVLGPTPRQERVTDLLLDLRYRR